MDSTDTTTMTRKAPDDAEERSLEGGEDAALDAKIARVYRFELRFMYDSMTGSSCGDGRKLGRRIIPGSNWQRKC
jgi:hypothetical protein